MEKSQAEKIKEKFPFGYKGIFTIKPVSFYIKDVFFIIGFILSISLSLVLWFFPEEQLLYIDILVNLIVTIIPAMLGLSLAGFAIVISQINEKALVKLTDVNIDDNKNYSMYQTLCAVFSVTVLIQIIPLVIAGTISLIKPLTLKLSVSYIAASLGNCTAIFLSCVFFLLSLFSIIDLIRNIFAAGELVNYVFTKNKLEESQKAP